MTVKELLFNYPMMKAKLKLYSILKEAKSNKIDNNVKLPDKDTIDSYETKIKLIDEMLTLLPVKQRKILELFYFERTSNKLIAKELRCVEETVKRNKREAISFLSKELEGLI